MGIGRFVYTPILPAMIEALGWSKVDAGVVASVNFLGYLIGALVTGARVFSRNPRRWLVAALLVSSATTAGMALTSQVHAHIALRFVSGIASAFTIVCSSTLVLERLTAAGRGNLASLHFAGVGGGIAFSAACVSALSAAGYGWQSFWAATGAASFVATLAVIAMVDGGSGMKRAAAERSAPQRTGAPLYGIAIAHGLFGFGYVVTATFIVAIVRETAAIRPLEPWIWLMVGLATIPSIPLWQRLGQRIGLLQAYAIVCLIEAAGVVASVEWVDFAGICLAALLLGGTFMGLTALGIMAARQLGGQRPQRAIALTTACFGLGQMAGPTVAGVLSEYTGNFRSASLLAAAALVLAAILASATAPARPKRGAETPP